MELFKKQICRTCMAEATESGTLHFIYDTATKKEPTTIADLLMGTIPKIHIKLSDELPKSICLQCLVTLLKIADFQKMCIKSQNEMLAMSVKVEASVNATMTDDMSALDNSQKNDKKKLITQQITKKLSKDKKLQIPIKDLENSNKPDLFDDTKEFMDLGSDVSIIDLTDKEPIKEPKTKTQAGRKPITLEASKKRCKEKNSNIPVEAVCLENVEISDLFDDFREFIDLDLDSSISDASNEEQKSNNQKTQLKRKLIISQTTKKEFKDKAQPVCNRRKLLNKAHSSNPKEHTSELDVVVSGRAKKSDNIEEKKDLDTIKEEKEQDPVKDADTTSWTIKYVCKCCRKEFSTEKNLNAHVWSAKGRYKCPFCPEVFNYPWLLQEHKKMHQKIKTNNLPYKCKHCESSFKCLLNLRSHLQVHINNKLNIEQKAKLIKENKMDEVTELMRNNKMEEGAELMKKHKLEEGAKLMKKHKMEEEAKLLKKHKIEEGAKLMKKRKMEEEAKLLKKCKMEEAAKLMNNKKEEDAKLMKKHKMEEEAKLRKKQKIEEEAKLLKKHKMEEDTKLMKKQKIEMEAKLMKKHKMEEEAKLLKIRKMEEEGKLMKKQKIEEEAKLMKKHKMEEEVKIMKKYKMEEEAKLMKKYKMEEASNLLKYKLLMKNNMEKEAKLIKIHKLEEEAKLIKKHEMEKSSFRCKHCYLMFLFRGDLVRHEFTHSEEYKTRFMNTMAARTITYPSMR